MDQLENNIYIRETCPKCGSPLLNIELTTYPPIPKKECTKCGWSWTGSPAKIVDVPFKEDDCTTKINIDEMRDATEEERKSTRDYIDSISYSIGKNIFDITNPKDKEIHKVHIIYGDSKGVLHHIDEPDRYRLYDNGRVIEIYKNKINYTICSDYIEIIEKDDE